ncbi:BTB/POZ domain-containing protein 2-like isoform X4 [Haliotis rufescens]|uniref:BTB/POZ domain-containing protein 2-like isoform X4 n=1 Tax=Haliotis rufescens TaxID=6454 RepID=UPI00201F2BC9|nr:BTB/POZ domain-containing protein 2-like isoform X4 [Haliotis rufescens]
MNRGGSRWAIREQGTTVHNPEDTIIGCNRRMFEKQLACDVKFKIGQSKSPVGAHKYLYCDEELIDSDNVLSVLYCCKKYNVQSLLTKCVDFVKQTMSVDNVCSLLEQAHIFDEQQLYQSCLSFIHQQGATVLQTDGFQELSRACVLDVISSNSLACQEHIVFVAMLRWAEAECKRQSKHVQDSTMRVVLGELVFQIRFGLLDMSYYSAQVSTRQILYDAEKLELFQAISGTTVRGMKFNGKQRNCPQRYESCRRGLKIF